MEQMMPSRRAADRGAGGLVTWNRNIEHREMRDFRGMVRCESKCSRRTPIVTDDGETRVTEMIGMSYQTSSATVFLS